MFSMISGLDAESQKKILEKWTELLEEEKKRKQNLSLKDLHIISQILKG